MILPFSLSPFTKRKTCHPANLDRSRRTQKNTRRWSRCFWNSAKGSGRAGHPVRLRLLRTTVRRSLVSWCQQILMKVVKTNFRADWIEYLEFRIILSRGNTRVTNGRTEVIDDSAVNRVPNGPKHTTNRKGACVDYDCLGFDDDDDDNASTARLHHDIVRETSHAKLV